MRCARRGRRQSWPLSKRRTARLTSALYPAGMRRGPPEAAPPDAASARREGERSERAPGPWPKPRPQHRPSRRQTRRAAPSMDRKPVVAVGPRRSHRRDGTPAHGRRTLNRVRAPAAAPSGAGPTTPLPELLIASGGASECVSGGRHLKPGRAARRQGDLGRQGSRAAPGRRAPEPRGECAGPGRNWLCGPDPWQRAV